MVKKMVTSSGNEVLLCQYNVFDDVLAKETTTIIVGTFS
jgi:hypothetical protein